jgi:peptidoglycan/xylan/chitin deacetylase (PgdA/CDA1 family)
MAVQRGEGTLDIGPVWKALFLALVLLPIAYLVLPHLAKNILRARFAHAARRSGDKFLTFDDGPDPESTPRILDILDAYGVKATFFVVGERAERYPAIVRGILSRGHEVGEHGYRHLHPWTARPVRYIRELARSARSARTYASPPARVIFRPPFGKLNLITMAYVIAVGRRLAFWDIDPRDYEGASADAVADHVLERLDHGAVVLLHDGRITAGTNSPDLTARALSAVLNRVGRGVRFRTVGTLGDPARLTENQGG